MKRKEKARHRQLRKVTRSGILTSTAVQRFRIREEDHKACFEFLIISIYYC